MKSSSFNLVSSVTQEDDPACIIPVKKYVSANTGLKLYVCNINGPVVEGYFSLATEAFDDDGLPHTLEHMIFLGSEDYPYSGIMDLLANKVYASGTNAWTDVDNTTYTLSTAEKSGFLQLLPIYLDHIFYPLLNESGYVTEVYHINGDGEDSGVVYSEMQSVENEDESVVTRALHRAMYSDVECGYRYETGGIMKNLRTSTSYQKVCDYHKKFYRPDNMAIIVAGQIDDKELIDVLNNFEKKLLTKNPERLKLSERPFSKPISPLTENIEQTVYFPCDEEKTSNGLVQVAWRGPKIADLKQVIALDLLLYYLTDSSISPLHSHFINKMSYCNKISYRIEEFRESFASIDFLNAQLEHLDIIKSQLAQLIDDLIEKKIPFDMNRMLNIIKMKISDIHDKLEDSPHETISQLCIGDFLYGNLDNENNFKQKFSQHKIFEALESESESFWLNVADKYLKSHSVTIIGKPCEKLMRSNGAEDQLRIDERKKNLGKKGLKELRVKVENAINQNDDFEVPDYVYNRLRVPSLEKVEYKKLKQFFSYNNNNIESNMNPIKNGFSDFKNLKHLQLQVDHLEGTNFVQCSMIIDTSHIEINLKPYLQLFIALLFELPIENSSISYTHEQTVYELNKDLLEFDASIGLNGDLFEPGIFPQYLSIFTKAPVKDYEKAVKWMKLIFFDTIFEKKQIKVVVSNLIKEIKKRKQQPFELIDSVITDLYFDKDCNLTQNNFLRQEQLLNDIMTELDENETAETAIEKKLNQLRNSLIRDKNFRFYICADLNRVQNILAKDRKMETIWFELFPSTMKNKLNQDLIFVSNQAFDVEFTWSFKKKPNSVEKLQRSPPNHPNDANNGIKIFTPNAKKDFIINLGSTDSSFLHIVSSIEIDSYSHPNYPALLVLIEYFTQCEGPLYEAVRGPGYAYNQSISINPETAKFKLSLNECSNLQKAYDATRTLFSEHLNNKSMFDGNLLESAKNSLIFLLIDDLKSVSNMSAFSMSCLFKKQNLSAIAELIKKIEKIEIKELRKLLKSYIMPLFDDETSNCLIVCNPSKSKAIIEEFNEKFDRKLNVIGKVDECLCAVNNI